MKDINLIASIQAGQTLCITTREIIVQGSLYEWWLYWRWGHQISLTATWLADIVTRQLTLYGQGFDVEKYRQRLSLLRTGLISLLATYANSRPEWNLFFPIWSRLNAAVS